MSAQRILRCPRPIGETLNKETLKAAIEAAHAKGREEGLRKYNELCALLEKAEEVLIGVEVFVKSKEQIKKPEGHAWFDEALAAIKQWKEKP